MSNYFPIPSPPPELVQEWTCLANEEEGQEVWSSIATQAAQWGADQELEACVNYIDNNMSGNKAREFRAIRRPKPPSLRKQAYDALDTYIYGEPDPKDKERTYNTIRRALEALND